MDMKRLSKEDLNDLKYAKALLENIGLAIKITNKIGLPIEKGIKLLPRGWNNKVNTYVQKALMSALNFAVYTLKDTSSASSNNVFHKLLVGGTGFLGGMGGLLTLPIELPVTTTLMLRSIAQIASGEGENIRNIESKLACIEVFALGGNSTGDDAAETGYFAVRAALAQEIAKAAEYISERGLADEGAPVIVRLIAEIASRFEINITEKAAAELMPLVGGIGGAGINVIFMHHFQNMAQGHFIVRRLERTYGPEQIQQAYRGA